MRRATSLAAALVLAAALAIPASAAASAPGANGVSAVNITATTAQLRGAVDPNGEATTYFFQYGTSTSYDNTTQVKDAGAGSGGRTVRETVSGLTPGTTYHYRVVATNPSGTTYGNDRTFQTRTPFVFHARRLALGYGEGPTFTGELVGPGISDRRIALEARTFPYAGPFAAVSGTETVTDAQGDFTLKAPPPLLATEYRVTTFDTPPSTSRSIKIGVRVRVKTLVNHRTVARGQRVTFTGTVTPGHSRVPYAVQKRKNGRWVTVAGAVTSRGNAKSSSFRKSVRVQSSGRYRIYVRVDDGDHLPRGGRAIQIRVR